MGEGSGDAESRTQRGLARLAGFSDGVFAIAITLLILNVDLPGDTGTTLSVADAMLAEWPDFLTYVISFLVIGNYWIGHHDVFDHVERYDRRLLWLNVVYLMFIAFIPFSTSLLGDYGGGFAVAVYASVLATTGVVFAALWRYAWRAKLLDGGVGRAQVHETTLGILAPSVVFAGSIPLAFLNAEWAMYSWLLLLIVDPVRHRFGRRFA